MGAGLTKRSKSSGALVNTPANRPPAQVPAAPDLVQGVILPPSETPPPTYRAGSPEEEVPSAIPVA
eukprot:3540235-Rhodomonas_salina.1